MRTPNDLELAKKCSKIDLILGGHDHVFEVNVVWTAPPSPPFRNNAIHFSF